MSSAAEITTYLEPNLQSVERIAHRKPKVIEIVEPDPKWPVSFAILSDRIRHALGARALTIEHVGSTSVRGMPAKDTIDIDLIVADPTKEEQYVPDLEAAGFQFLLRERPWHEHRFFGFHEPHANLHVWGSNCPETVRHCLFRDWLNEHEDDRIKYANIKREAAAASREAGETMDEYNVRKESVIHEILNRIFHDKGLLTNE